MITFKTLTLRNFLSYGNVDTVIDLTNIGTTLIVGENLDDTVNGLGGNGVGKAMPLHCKIKTPTGWTTMGSISVGDVIVTPSGEQATVTGTYPQGVRPVYRITFSDGRTTEADENHLWKVFSHRWGKSSTRGEKLISTLELKRFVDESITKKRPFYNMFVPTVRHPETKDVAVTIDPYLLGAMLGDGCLTGNAALMLSSADEHIVNKVNLILSRDHDQHLTQYGQKNRTSGYDWCVANNIKHSHNKNSFQRALKNIGLYPSRSNTKFIPQNYLEGTSTSQKFALLQGLLDTDGTVSKTRGVSFSSVSKQLAEGVQYLIRSLGGKSRIAIRTPFYKSKTGDRIYGQLCYEVSIDYRTPSQLFSLQRKLDRVTKGQTQYANVGLRVSSVEYIRDDETKCIMVDHPDHLYIVDDFIVTHNTTILNAVTYALFDKPISNISKDNLINNINKKNMSVKIEFSIKDMQYTILRVRGEKAGQQGNYVKFIENGRDITPDSISNANDLIEKTININYDVFTYMIAFTASKTPFLDLPTRSPTATNQTDMIERLFALTTLSDSAIALKTQIKDTEQRLSLHKVKITHLEQEHARHEELIQSSKRRVLTWEQQTAKSITELNNKLNKLVDVSVLEKEHQLHTELQSCKDVVTTLTTKLQTLNNSMVSLNKQQNKERLDLNHLMDATCPYCLQHYSNEDKATECTHKISDLDDQISSLSSTIETTKALHDGATKNFQHIKSQITIPNLKELMDIHNESSTLKQRCVDLERSDNPHLEALNELEQTTLEPIDYSQVNELDNLLTHQNFLLKLLTKKDSFVRKALLNKNLPYLNQQLKHYLDLLGLPHRVEFTHELKAEISQFGRFLDFGNLSAGQQARVNIALSFAFRDILEKMHNKINIYMLDEIIDIGLDYQGVQAVTRMLKRKAREEKIGIWIISHRNEVDSAFDRTMTVRMQNGFSSIVNNGVE